MKVVGISDIHGDFPPIPSCDVVCICGDILPLHIQRNFKASWIWLQEVFTEWANSLDCKHVVFIAGNHDFIFDEKYNLGTDMSDLWKGNDKIHYLYDNSIEIEGKVFYGTPWIPSLYNWAFYLDSNGLTDKFSQIPSCDVLLSHCPPKVENAGVVLQLNHNYGKDFGCEELRLALDKDIKWLLCGHIHSGDHEITKYKNINIVNVSSKDENYDMIYKPYGFEI